MIWTRENQKGLSRIKTYCNSVLRIRENHKELLSVKVLRRRANKSVHKIFNSNEVKDAIDET